MIPSVVGLVLAAGAGRRMGGPKALLRLAPDGPTLVERAVQVVRAGGCERVSVVVGAASERAEQAAQGVGAQIVHAPDWAEGMGASLRAGLRAVSADPGAQAVLVMLVDLPDVDDRVVARVLEQAIDGPKALARAAYSGRPGHPVLIGRAWWDEVTVSAQGDRGARAFLARRPARLVECGDLAAGHDVDLPSQL